MNMIIILWLILLSCHIFAQTLTTIYDSGNTFPLDDYKEAVQPDTTPNKPAFRESKKAFLPTWPLTTSAMTPNRVATTPRSLPYLQVPFFIIGHDRLSKQWLAERKEALIRLNAVGMVVEVASLDELNEIKQLADGLRIYPASGNDIAAQLGLKHYPVLISPQGIEQ